MKEKVFQLFCMIFLVAASLFAAVEGVVVTAKNMPVEGARVELVDGSGFCITDAHGIYRFPESDPPISLRISHPRFQLLEVDLGARSSTTLILVPKQKVFGEVVVTANRESDSSIQPISVAGSSASADARPAPVTSVVDLASGLPSVAETGQGGLFQAYSIRGTGGQRVLSLVAGTRILTERRAGATASFIDPLLLRSVNVIRGPYSSYYGSGALGGVLEAVPQRFDRTMFATGWETEGDANYQMVGLDLSGWSIGLARRSSNPTKTPEGELEPSQFQQYSATVGKLWTLSSGLEVDLLVIPSRGDDIGKPNTRYPGRITTYPDERHLVSRLSIRRPGKWHLDFYGHPNSLETENVKSDEHSLVKNEAFDFGLNYQYEADLPASFAARVGLDYFGRRGVRATETIDDLNTGLRDRFRTLDGRQDEAAAYGSIRRSFGSLSAELGGRFSWIEQSNAGSGATDDTAATGFLGLSVPVGHSLEFVANLGSGYRFPGLSERFYSGSTGRGEVVANENLDPERSLSTDVGLRFFGSRLFLAAYLYHTEIDDYIERIDLEDGVRTYVNLTSGTIEGIEIEGFFQVTDALKLQWAGEMTDGEAEDGSPLAESPADRITLGGRYSTGPWSGRLRWQHRFDKNDPGPGEVPTKSADIVSASLSYTMADGLSLVLFGRNLLDETYLPTADDLAVPVARRSVGVGLHWGS